MTRLKEPIRCSCGECGSEFLRWRNRGSLTQCSRCSRRLYIRTWKFANTERKRALNAKWSAENREKDRALKAAWSKRNPASGAAKTRRRWAAKAKRTPSWANFREIRVFYEIAARATKCTGVQFSVDHIVPLRGKTVSGLHVRENLRVMPQHANLLKRNHFSEAA